MFQHMRGVHVSRQEELEVDYMARALLMPRVTMTALLKERGYENMSADEKKCFAWYVAERFQVPVEQAVIRIKEIQTLEREINNN